MAAPTINHAVPTLSGTKMDSTSRAICRMVLARAFFLSLAVYHEVSMARLLMALKMSM